LSYGVVPTNYSQAVPGSTQVAPALTPGRVYSFFAETTGAPAVDGFFYMDESGPIQTLVPDLCTMLENGRQIRVSCKTKQPYEEPLDLKEMTLRNKINQKVQNRPPMKRPVDWS
jgi:hypothetical protein